MIIYGTMGSFESFVQHSKRSFTFDLPSEERSVVDRWLGSDFFTSLLPILTL